ncbi:glycosyltransferase [Ketobacter sp.]|uniref:glycosyltransferase n=1 Tax=Ketobacter sp. TaxID=2083498 RepID=UPI000F150C41|nr:glycosyltransferase [Ketobacter sp.]RLT92288.1 MAG: glycosyltransferase family 1 protein [Ketobacter sp.]
MTKVCFCVRNDFHHKFGGDTLQISKYIENSPDGFECEIVTYSHFKDHKAHFHNSYDIFVLTNIDRCYEYLGFYTELRKNVDCSRLVVLPIHHSQIYVESYYLKFHPLLWRPIKLFGGILFIEKIKSLIHMIRENGDKKIPYLGLLLSNYKSLIAESLVKCAGWICIAEGEANSIKSDFGIDKPIKYSICQNGADINSSSNFGDRNIDILVCGRIEKRKNQLEVAKLLSKSPYKVCFVGALNENHKQYSKEFLDIIGANKNLFYLGKKSPQEISQLYLDAKLHLSASWFEVSSLVDLEAYIHGCYVVSSKNGYTSEILDQHSLTLIDPSNLIDLVETVEKVLNSNRNDLDSRHRSGGLNTWKKSAEDFFSGIQSITATSHSKLNPGDTPMGQAS